MDLVQFYWHNYQVRSPPAPSPACAHPLPAHRHSTLAQHAGGELANGCTPPSPRSTPGPRRSAAAAAATAGCASAAASPSASLRGSRPARTHVRRAPRSRDRPLPPQTHVGGQPVPASHAQPCKTLALGAAAVQARCILLRLCRQLAHNAGAGVCRCRSTSRRRST